MTKQFIHYHLDLSHPNHPYLGQFTINLILLVPSQYIATDIQTGFPQLMQSIRESLDNYLSKAYEEYQQSEAARNLRPLQFIDGFMMMIEPRIQLFIDNHPQINLDSLSVEIFSELLNNFSHTHLNP